MVRVITISREYGSGGGSVARILSERLGWRLIDDSLLAQIARRARATPDEVALQEEAVDPWSHRVFKALWLGGFTGVATSSERGTCDAEGIARLWHKVICEAAEIGECVAVGRGGQCLLQRRRDAFHVHIHAPLHERMERLRSRLAPGTDLAAAAQESDNRRVEYIHHYFGQDWRNPHLYHLMVCSTIGFDRVADTILCAAGLAGGRVDAR